MYFNKNLPFKSSLKQTPLIPKNHQTNMFPSPCCSDESRMISSVGERQLIEYLREWLGPIAPPSPAGMGDDCAVLRAPSCAQTQLLTTDSLTYGQHFDDTASPREAGAKLIKRNLSDIAAMGGQPGPALLNLLCGPDLAIEWLQHFVTGIRECCEQYSVAIVGGDISQLAAGHFTAALTLSGYIEGQPALRSTAAIGDAIYVTGTLGGSIRGKHLHFAPRMQEGQWLAAHQACSAMMDLTDGLGKDLAALMPAGSSAAINLQQLPISADAHACASTDGASPEAHAFCDGEDYELLFTVAEGTKQAVFASEWSARFPNLKLSRIGSLVAAHPAGCYIDAVNGDALPWHSGFEHFKIV
jgi:thiamine-monophosphate kinase